MTPSTRGGLLRIGVDARVPIGTTAQDQFGAWTTQPPILSVEGLLRLQGGDVVATGLGQGAVHARLGKMHSDLPPPSCPPIRSTSQPAAQPAPQQ